MKKLLMALALTIAAVSAHARSPDEVGRDINKAASAAVSAYKKGGVSGLIEATKACYRQLDKKQFYCGYLDMASRYIDLRMAAAIKAPRHEFFYDEAFQKRMAEIFNRAGMDMNQANEYLKTIMPIMHDKTEGKLSGQ